MKLSSYFNNRLRYLSIVLVVWAILVTWLVDYSMTPYERIPKGNVPGYSYAIEPSIISWEDSRLVRLSLEDDEALARRLNKVINSAFYHCNPDDAARPLDKLIYAILPRVVMQDGFLGPKNMRCGFCHQSAYLLSRALVANEIESHPLGIKGHVVSLVKLNNKQYIYDPDFGVGPIDYENYQYDVIRSIYKKEGRWTKALEPVYATRDDDLPYSRMTRLWVHERIQAMITFGLEAFLLLLVVVSWLVFMRALYVFFKLHLL